MWNLTKATFIAATAVLVAVGPAVPQLKPIPATIRAGKQ
ncbi:hypothetical protein I553_5194 [Mycobacterium xenopi 4042]|uniref:Uncharacterized protein n=1 Tax=Mycobacterium xenopi 4042 TaxID=1299334 RepID=X7ZUC5_MYCXE|nr:hypothetical protein I553_5194 [Mycobacterium xenopi 4042]